MSKGVQFLMKKNKIDVINGFGKIVVKGSSLVPLPPAIIITGTIFLEFFFFNFFSKTSSSLEIPTICFF